MANIGPIDMRIIEDIFEMHSGYVLDFSNRTFDDFFEHEVGVDIYAEKFSEHGDSKGKRLRFFIQNADKSYVVKALKALWRYREATRKREGRDERVTDADSDLKEVIDRLQGTHVEDTEPTPSTPDSSPNTKLVAELSAELMHVSQLAPQPRGYAFEQFLNRLFDAYKMEPRGAFRLQGEQIDGSFSLSSDVYLLEAKWQNTPIGAADLHTFHGKLDQKAAWARGLFVSMSGFSDEGLVAFGRAKSIICMDGFDLSEILDQKLDFRDVLTAKVRRAAETGSPFTRVRDLTT